MRNVNLEENELTITTIFQQHTKEETIQTLKEALEVLEQEESDPENDEMIDVYKRQSYCKPYDCCRCIQSICADWH